MELARTDYYTIERGTGAGIIRLAWTDRTQEMTDVELKEGLSRLASIAAEYRSPLVMVDVSRFLHQPGEFIEEWRTHHVVPQFNNAGVRKMAVVWGEISKLPEDPDYPGPGEHFVTKNFADRESARDWLLGN